MRAWHGSVRVNVYTITPYDPMYEYILCHPYTLSTTLLIVIRFTTILHMYVWCMIWRHLRADLQVRSHPSQRGHLYHLVVVGREGSGRLGGDWRRLYNHREKNETRGGGKILTHSSQDKDTGCKICAAALKYFFSKLSRNVLRHILNFTDRQHFCQTEQTSHTPRKMVYVP